jgi:hypothetical protein
LQLTEDGEDGGDVAHGPETGGEVTTVGCGGASSPPFFPLRWPSVDRMEG